ncbi:hypothetical protein [Nonomuraea sp. bgisy101]|uniref:hypothetical protein n=1 Tax=Nonomuraea sp. bgisy101 TaxID=3413784 RepID=UPI003D717797
MFDFGIPGYRAEWLSGRSAIAAAHGNRLARLTGRRLTRALLVWDIDEDEWFADCPVILDFEGEQVEIEHRKFDKLSITWNTIDPAGSPDWPDFPSIAQNCSPRWSLVPSTPPSALGSIGRVMIYTVPAAMP